jgi:hypothetical protein
MRWSRWLVIDPFIAAMLATVAVATLLPVHGAGAEFVVVAATLAIGLLFFLHRARIAPREALAGAFAWTGTTDGWSPYMSAATDRTARTGVLGVAMCRGCGLEISGAARVRLGC